MEISTMDYRRSVWFGALALIPLFAGAQPGNQARSYTIDATESDVHWRVYKAGAFARFGHNHVISVGGLAGTVDIDASGAADWAVSFAVDDLVVDDPALRDLYGEDFASEPTADDIAGTKRNMLSETVLNGAEFGTITLRGGGYTGSLANAELNVTIQMLGRSIDLVLPGRISTDGDTLIAEGEFSLQHEDLGMTPFSVMMGALQVGPQIDFSYKIHAVAAD